MRQVKEEGKERREGHEEPSKRGRSVRAVGHSHAGTFGGSAGWGDRDVYI